MNKKSNAIKARDNRDKQKIHVYNKDLFSSISFDEICFLQCFIMILLNLKTNSIIVLVETFKTNRS